MGIVGFLRRFPRDSICPRAYYANSAPPSANSLCPIQL